MRKGFLQIIKKIYDVIIEYHVMWYLIATFMLIYLWNLLENDIVFKLRKIVTLDIKIESHWILKTVTGIIVICFFFDIIKRIKNRSVFPLIFSYLILMFTVAYLKLRFSNEFIYLSFIGPISYTDIFVFLSLTYSVVNILFILRKNEQKQPVQDAIINDGPVQNKENDILGYSSDAESLAKKICNLDGGKSWSLGIVSSWGDGKTSFLNLIEAELKKECIVIKFNPRNSFSVSKIQEDFFALISSKIEVYDMKISFLIKKYMSSLLVVDTKGFVSKVMDFLKAWNKNNEKDSISSSLLRLKKKVVIFIDDFDRLTAQEIIEVFKLIDGNASFSNTIFLTAYDKAQIRKVLGNSYFNGESDFSEKFFNVEYTLPLVNYRILFNELKSLFVSNVVHEISEEMDIEAALEDFYYDAKLHLKNLRDIKRYVNVFANDYPKVQGEVVLIDYMRLVLIKVKYYVEYKRLYEREILIDKSNQYEYLLDSSLDSGRSSKILEKMFSKNAEFKGFIYRRICEKASFDLYFYGQTADSLLVRDMKKIIVSPYEESKQVILQWSKSNQIYDFINYLTYWAERAVSDINTYWNFFKVLVFVSSIRPHRELIMTILNLISRKGFEKQKQQYDITFEDYKQKVCLILKTVPETYNFVKSLIIMIREENVKGKLVLTEEELREFVVDGFIELLHKKKSVDEDVMSSLYQCVDRIEEHPRRVILNKRCCDEIRRVIKSVPGYYINSFVRLGMVTSSADWNSITCEPFWEQIFENADNFEDFINSEPCRSVEKIDLVKRFWSLYKANNYQSIEFNENGDVQKKIDSNLKEEYEMLQKIQGIESGYNRIFNEWNKKRNIKKIANYINDLQKLDSDLNVIVMKIALSAEVRDKIRILIQELNEEQESAKMSEINNFRVGDFVKIRDEVFPFYKDYYTNKDNVFCIKKFHEDFCELEELRVSLLINELEPILIDGVQDKNIYYAPAIAAQVVAVGDEIPNVKKNYSYYLDEFENVFDENGQSFKSIIQENEFKYVHEVQHWLGNDSKYLKIRHEY